MKTPSLTCSPYSARALLRMLMLVAAMTAGCRSLGTPPPEDICGTYYRGPRVNMLLLRLNRDGSFLVISGESPHSVKQDSEGNWVGWSDGVGASGREDGSVMEIVTHHKNGESSGVWRVEGDRVILTPTRAKGVLAGYLTSLVIQSYPVASQHKARIVLLREEEKDSKGIFAGFLRQELTPARP